MLNQSNHTWVVATLSLLMLGLAVPTRAREPSRGGFGPPGFAGPRPAGGFAGRVLERLVSPCRAGCLETMRTCHDTAETDVLSCAQEACATEIETAQSACATDRTSQACRVAVNALRSRGDACLETFQDEVTACRDALDVCHDACESAP